MREMIIDCWDCEGAGCLQSNGEDCETCATSGSIKVIYVGPAVLSNAVVRHVRR